MPAGVGAWKSPDGRSPGEHYMDRMIAEREGLAGCARCFGTHKELDWKRFQRPAPSAGGQYTAWATCPTTGDPILFEIQVAADA